ncbi:phosphotransferase [Brevibacillus composti]|uniref:Phosphotransferase n=1 Tax=Brevibacillus composti TaxID=2796470 RepID=A0A7T5JMR4_9BACL|nr:phosphotransferase [Brevibacillus composti]QQE73276.1 phosphotransferase [Brevibacillus composti]QUO40357.1 phosphotransferase [Brevibacillus composti]
MNKSIVPSLEKAFRCRIYGARPRRNVSYLKTDRGHWILKGYKQREKADWVIRLSEFLRHKGFLHTVQYIADSTGEKIFPYGGKFYTIMKMIDGRESDNASLSDVKKAAMTLARFHQAARHFPSSEPFPIDGKPALLDKWEGRLEHFERITWQIEQKGPQNRLEQLIMEMAEEAIHDARHILQAAYKMPLTAELFAAYEHGTLAHRDVASHNFLLTPRGSCYLIDLDTVGQDMQLVDLVQFMGRMLLLQEYRLSSFVEAIDAYSQIHYLSDTQIWMIHQLLRYPDNLLREVTGVYGNRPGYHMRGVIQLTQMEERLREARQDFLRAGVELFHHSPWGKYHFVG